MSPEASSFPESKLKRYALLFIQGEPCHGVWILMRGKVAIGIKAGNCSLTIKYAEPGAVLGLAEALSGGTYGTTAVAATDVEVQFVPRNDILEVLQRDTVTGVELIQSLSHDVANMYRTVRRAMPRTFVN